MIPKCNLRSIYWPCWSLGTSFSLCLLGSPFEALGSASSWFFLGDKRILFLCKCIGVEGRNNQEPSLHDPETQCGPQPPPPKKGLRFGRDDSPASVLPKVKGGFAFVPSLMNGSKVFTEPGNTSFVSGALLTQAVKLGAITLGGGLNGTIVGGERFAPKPLRPQRCHCSWVIRKGGRLWGPPGIRVVSTLTAFLGLRYPQETPTIEPREVGLRRKRGRAPCSMDGVPPEYV